MLEKCWRHFFVCVCSMFVRPTQDGVRLILNNPNSVFVRLKRVRWPPTEVGGGMDKT